MWYLSMIQIKNLLKVQSSMNTFAQNVYMLLESKIEIKDSSRKGGFLSSKAGLVFFVLFCTIITRCSDLTS